MASDVWGSQDSGMSQYEDKFLLKTEGTIGTFSQKWFNFAHVIMEIEILITKLLNLTCVYGTPIF